MLCNTYNNSTPCCIVRSLACLLQEGQLVTLIDSSNLPTGTVWHIVDMEWLSK